MNYGEEMVCFFEEVGTALTLWGTVEKNILNIALIEISKADTERFARGFLSIENFRSKLNFADTAINYSPVMKPHLEDWQQVHKRIVAASKLRNKLAHYHRTYFEAAPVGRRLALCPWSENLRSFELGVPPAGSLCIRDIAGFKNQFFSLVMLLINMNCRIRGMPERHAKHLEQPIPIQTLQALKSHLYEKLQLQPQSLADLSETIRSGHFL